MAKEGKSGAEIEARMKELIPKVRASFVVDTLVFLHRGGRCSGLSAMLGGALKLHPKIEVINGAMGAGKKPIWQSQNSMESRGMVSTDRSVLMKVVSVMSVASRPSFRQRMVP